MVRKISKDKLRWHHVKFSILNWEFHMVSPQLVFTYSSTLSVFFNSIISPSSRFPSSAQSSSNIFLHKNSMPFMSTIFPTVPSPHISSSLQHFSNSHIPSPPLFLRLFLSFPHSPMWEVLGSLTGSSNKLEYKLVQNNLFLNIHMTTYILFAKPTTVNCPFNKNMLHTFHKLEV